MPRSVFISYARKDAQWVGVACRLFQVTGTRTFLDISDIEFGARWQDELTKAIQECKRVVVFWSEAASKSEWVEREWRLALTLNKRIVPVLIDATPLCKELSVFNASTDLLDLMKLAQAHFDADEAIAEGEKRGSKELISFGSVASFVIDAEIDIQPPSAIPLILWRLVEKPVRALVHEIVMNERRRWAREAERRIAEELRQYASRVNAVFQREMIDARYHVHDSIVRLAEDFLNRVFAD